MLSIFECKSNEDLKTYINSNQQYDLDTIYNVYGQSIIHNVKCPLMLETLLENKFSPNIQDIFYKKTLAHFNPSLEFLQILNKYNADFNIRDIYGKTPLFYMSKKIDKEKISFILKNGADPNIKDIFGNRYN